MAYPHDIRCPTNPWKPEPVGFDDLTGFKVYLKDMEFQYEWSGPRLYNTRFLRPPQYLDVPNEQARTIIIGPDPVPLKDIRPGFQTQQENSVEITPTPGNNFILNLSYIPWYILLSTSYVFDSLGTPDVGVDVELPVPASVSITLPFPTLGRVVVVKDGLGQAADFPIDLIGTVDGNVNPVISTSFASITLIGDGVGWEEI